MNLLQINQGSKHFGARMLFERATFAINEGEHVGVIGPNGAGKTTLFKILVDLEHLDSGDLIKSKSLRIGYLEQESEWRLDQTSIEYLSENCSKPLWQLKKIGEELGLSEEHFQTPLQKLSGGYRMRMKLLYLIGQEPNLMLLDEPTNFLDLESILVLEKFLQGFEGAFLLISHDREFLRRTTESTLEVEAGDITKFPGNIDDYFEQKAQLRETLEAQAANLDAKRKHMESFVERFRAKATKAKQAQSRMKQLEKMEKIELKDLPVRAKIKIPAPIHTGKEIVSLANANIGYGDKKVLSDVNLQIERGAHIGIVGYNGAGKSTLLKSLAEQLPLLSGERKLGYQVSLAYFAQHSSESLNANDSVLEALQSAAHSDVLAQEILNMAGSLLFSGDNVQKKIKVLSGGEKSRVALGQILLKKSPFLLMDEPTNHLDFDTVEAMTEALRDYAGTLIVVSHDRSFIGRIATKIFEIRNGRVEVYPGTYDEYVWSLEKGALKSLQEDTPAIEKKTLQNSNIEQPQAPIIKFNYKDESKRLRGEITELKRKILKCEELLHAKSQKRDQLTTDLLTASGAQAQTLAKDLGACSQEIDKLEEDLLNHMENLERAEKALVELQS